MRWSENVTLQFVKLYLKYECLWNPEHADYKLIYERQKHYHMIASEFEVLTGKKLCVPEIKTKIKNLRSTYAQEVHKILRKSNPDYEPSLVWFHEMDRCLKRFPLKQSVASKIHQEAVEVDSSTQMWLDQETMDEIVEDENPDPLTSQTDEECLLEQPHEEVAIKQEHRNPFKKMKKKKFKHRSSFYAPNSNLNEREDEFDIYGKFIATQLRQMNLQNALRLQMKIQSLISQTRLSDLS